MPLLFRIVTGIGRRIVVETAIVKIGIGVTIPILVCLF
jgi:hypothetical protein